MAARTGATGSERGSGRSGARTHGLVTPLDVGGTHAPGVRPGRPVLPALRWTDAAHRRDRGPGCHSTDPHPSRTPGHPGWPAASEFPAGRRSRAAHTPRHRRLGGAEGPGRRRRPPCGGPAPTWRTPALYVDAPVYVPGALWQDRREMRVVFIRAVPGQELTP